VAKSGRAKFARVIVGRAAARCLTDVACALISAPEAERQGLYPDWPTWPLGTAVAGSWEWLFDQVEAGALPDVPCRWSDRVDPGRAAIYWLDADARTRHLVLGYGQRILTSHAEVREVRCRMQ
jgi:hypothetical protein